MFKIKYIFSTIVSEWNICNERWRDVTILPLSEKICIFSNIAVVFLLVLISYKIQGNIPRIYGPLFKDTHDKMYLKASHCMEENHAVSDWTASGNGTMAWRHTISALAEFGLVLLGKLRVTTCHLDPFSAGQWKTMTGVNDYWTYWWQRLLTSSLRWPRWLHLA